MKYTEKTFALPAANTRQSQKDWDRAFMSPEEFEAKYGKENKQRRTR